jgi:uncharacterized protein DUF397
MPNVSPDPRTDEPDSVSRWVKSSLSFANGDCVEVASLPGDQVGVRDSKDTEGPVLRFTPSEWDAFLGGVRNGEFDIFTTNLSIRHSRVAFPRHMSALTFEAQSGVAWYATRQGGVGPRGPAMAVAAGG